jgi:hypothetical protein
VRARRAARADSASGPNPGRRPAKAKFGFFQFPNFKSNEIQTSNYILNKKKTFSGIDPKIKVAQK